MVKLSRWEDINKALFRRHLPQTISARELFVFRQFDLIFSNKLENAEAHQCFCGQLFLIPKNYLQGVQKDSLGNQFAPSAHNQLKTMKIESGVENLSYLES